MNKSLLTQEQVNILKEYYKNLQNLHVAGVYNKWSGILNQVSHEDVNDLESNKERMMKGLGDAVNQFKDGVHLDKINNLENATDPTTFFHAFYEMFNDNVGYVALSEYVHYMSEIRRSSCNKAVLEGFVGNAKEQHWTPYYLFKANNNIQLSMVISNFLETLDSDSKLHNQLEEIYYELLENKNQGNILMSFFDKFQEIISSDMSAFAKDNTSKESINIIYRIWYFLLNIFSRYSIANIPSQEFNASGQNALYEMPTISDDELSLASEQDSMTESESKDWMNAGYKKIFDLLLNAYKDLTCNFLQRLTAVNTYNDLLEFLKEEHFSTKEYEQYLRNHEGLHKRAGLSSPQTELSDSDFDKIKTIQCTADDKLYVQGLFHEHYSSTLLIKFLPYLMSRFLFPSTLDTKQEKHENFVSEMARDKHFKSNIYLINSLDNALKDLGRDFSLTADIIAKHIEEFYKQNPSAKLEDIKEFYPEELQDAAMAELQKLQTYKKDMMEGSYVYIPSSIDMEIKEGSYVYIPSITAEEPDVNNNNNTCESNNATSIVEKKLNGAHSTNLPSTSFNRLPPV